MIQYREERLGCDTHGSIAGQPMPASHKLVAGQKSFTYQGPKLANNLDFYLADCDIVNTFKRRMTQYHEYQGMIFLSVYNVFI